jgi:hydrogenase expression/formation protein HypC
MTTPGEGGQGPVTKERGLGPSAGSGGSLPRDSNCHDDVCITCSDAAVEVTVLRLLGDGLAVVDTGQGEEEVSVALVEARAGDRILVHAGEAIATVGR